MMHVKAKTRVSQNSCSDQKQCSIAKHAKHFAAGKIPKNRMAFIFLKWKQFGINRTLETFELAGHPINQKSRDFSRSDPVVVLTEILCGDERTFRRTQYSNDIGFMAQMAGRRRFLISDYEKKDF